VDDALVPCLVDLLHGGGSRYIGIGAGLGGGEGCLDAGPQLGAHRTVADATLLVLAVSLDLALDVGHGDPYLVLDVRAVGRRSGRPDAVRAAAKRSGTPGGSRPTAPTGRVGRYRSPRMEISRLRNTSIIAHIDHGKSTLADRMLELCGAVDPREMRAQYLDSMDIERERGITIKLQSVRLDWGDTVINLIDTPGHVDFGYEVSRSLAACEGVILVVDAAQGIEAQTLANCYLALENDLEIVAVLNKIDLPAAEPERYAEEIETVLGIPAEEILHVSAKTGDGVAALLDAVVARTPPPTGDPDAPLQALVFDSHFDQYRGVVSSVRIMHGRLRTDSTVRFMQAGAVHEVDEIGVRRPDPTPVAELGPGEVGYLMAGVKDVGEARSGETVTTSRNGSDVALEGYREPKPMVF